MNVSAGGSGQARASARRPSAHTIAFVALLAVYLLVTLGVIFQSPLLRLDTDLFKLDLRRNYPEWKQAIHQFVILGQRGPATMFFLPFFFWRAWRDRTPRPLVMLVTSLILLNLSVGIVKLATGRIGPGQTHKTHDVFVGGDIYPSGHVSNTVVLYGLMAMIAVSYRRLIAVAAVLLSVFVGLSTVYLDTHWFSDVIGGWIAGGLVLMALPWATPTAERWFAAAWHWIKPSVLRARRHVRSTIPGPPAPRRPAPAPMSGHADPRRSAPRAPRHASPRDTSNGTPVSSTAASHSLAATAPSLDARDDPTSLGEPRTSPIPSGP